MPRSAPLLATAAALLSACHSDGPLSAVPTRSHLEISVQPAVARVGSPLGVQPVVAVRDDRGHLVRDTIPLTVSLSSGDGEVLGTVTVAAKNGIARFTDVRLSGTYGPKTLTFTAPGLTDVTATTVGLRPPNRSVEDRVDDFTGPQVHVIYVVPLGASDRKLDTELDIANSVGVFQTWLSRATGLQIRFDRYDCRFDSTGTKESSTSPSSRWRSQTVRCALWGRISSRRSIASSLRPASFDPTSATWFTMTA